MRIVFLGSGEFAAPSLRALAAEGCEIPIVLTQPAKESGRGRRVTPTPVRTAARDIGLTVLEVENVNAPVIVERVRSSGAALGVVVAFGQKLGLEFLQSLPGGFINLHASLLPKYRGAAPINWAIVRHERETGCTVFRIVEKMDAGPILASASTGIGDEETAGELHDRLALLGVDVLRQAMALLADASIPNGRPQDDANATLAPKLAKSNGALHFDHSPADFCRFVHGMNPWPGAQARFEGADGRWENVILLRARPANESASSRNPPGHLNERLQIAVRGGSVEVREIKPASGRAMDWRDYVNGRRVTPKDRFTAPDHP